MIDFKTTTLLSKGFLLITLLWIYPSLCLASGTGSIYYLDPMPLRPMSIRTSIEPALPTDGENALEEIGPMPPIPMSIRTGIEPALHTGGENALEEIEPMPHVQNELRHEVQHPAEHKVEQAATPPLPSLLHQLCKFSHKHLKFYFQILSKNEPWLHSNFGWA